MTGERNNETGGSGGEAGADERLVEFLRTADRPRHVASDVAAALDATRGRVRTRLQALADEGRVVRTDAEGTARWAVPGRVDEPEPESDPDPEPTPTNGGSGGDGRPGGEGPDEGGTGDPESVPVGPTGNEEGPAPRDEATGWESGVEPAREDDPSDAGHVDGTDVPATASGPSEDPSGGPSDGRPVEPATRPPAGGPDRRRAVVAGLALVAALVLALAVLGRLRRE